MADNVSLNAGSGGQKLKTQQAADGAHYPVMKLADGTANSDTLLHTGNGLAANALRATLASNSSGQVKIAEGAAVIGEVTIGAGKWDSGDLGKRLNRANASGDVSIAGLARRTDTPANQSGTDGDYEWPQISGGRVWAKILGDAAHDAVVSGKPVLLGFEGREIDGTGDEVAEGDLSRFIGEKGGRSAVTMAHPRGFHASADYGASAQTNTTVQAAAGAGLSLYITDLSIRNGTLSSTASVLDSDGNAFNVSQDVLDSDGNSFEVATDVLDSDGNSFSIWGSGSTNNVTLLNGSGGSVLFECYLGTNGGISTNLRQPIRLDANTLLAVTSSANAQLSLTVNGYIGN